MALPASSTNRPCSGTAPRNRAELAALVGVSSCVCPWRFLPAARGGRSRLFRHINDRAEQNGHSENVTPPIAPDSPDSSVTSRGAPASPPASLALGARRLLRRHEPGPRLVVGVGARREPAGAGFRRALAAARTRLHARSASRPRRAGREAKTDEEVKARRGRDGRGPRRERSRPRRGPAGRRAAAAPGPRPDRTAAGP